MAVNKRKILESARKLAQKGAKDKALKEYQRLLKVDPRDAKLRLEIGDTHRRWGQVEEAIDTYTRVAEQYMAEGFDARAVAVYKQIVNLDPDCLEAYTPLAELYERMGLSAEAIASLQTAADGYHRQGKKTEALGLLRKMANADSTNTTSRIKVADLLRQEGMIEEAISEYVLAARELERQGEVETVSKIQRRILELDETHVGALDALARNLAERGKVAESLPLAERALALDPGVPERYETLAGLYGQIGREEERVGVYRKLADLHRERGDDDTARNILQRYVPSEELSRHPASGPADDELSGDSLLEETGSDLFGEGLPVDESDAEPSLDFANEDRLDVAPLSGDESLVLGSAEAGLEADLDLDVPHDEDAIPLDVPVEEPNGGAADLGEPEVFDVEQLLAEASVYLRYGKRDRAIAHLERVLESDPEHRSALEKLGEVFAEAGEVERAVEVWLRAAKRASDEDDEEGLSVLKSRIATLDENAAAHILPGESAAPAAPEPPLSLEEEAPAELDLDLGALEDGLSFDADDDELLDDEILEGELPEPGEAADESGGVAAVDPEVPQTPLAAEASSSSSLSTSTAQQIQEDLEEADFYVDQGLLDEAEEIYQRVLALAPNHPRALLRLGEVAATRGGDPAGAAAAADVLMPSGGALDSETIPGEFEVSAEEPLPETSPDDPSPEEWAAESDDAEFSIDVPSEEEEEFLAKDVGELSDLDLDAASEAADSEAEAEPDGSDTEEFEVSEPEAGGEFDLAAALADAFDDDDQDGSSSSSISADVDGFDAVFGAFKKGVSETLGEGDHQAHYDLAIAYKEMGLHDDAIAELEITMTEPSRTVECLHLIALCALDADRAPTAVEHLERLLARPDLPEEVVLAGRFDLGRALAGVGDREAAREAWSQVAAERPGFQNVEVRLAELDSPDAADDEDEEGFESFEDVMEAVFEDDEPEPAAESAPESEPLSEPEILPEADPPPPGRKKRKKISFV